MEETPSCLLTQGTLVGTGLMGIQMTSTAQTEEVCPGADGASSRLTASVFQSVPLEVCQSNAVDPGRMCNLEWVTYYKAGAGLPIPSSCQESPCIYLSSVSC